MNVLDVILNQEKLPKRSDRFFVLCASLTQVCYTDQQLLSSAILIQKIDVKHN
jgi:hypothetical protein